MLAIDLASIPFLLFCAAPIATAQEPRLSDEQLLPLAQALALHREARSVGQGVEEAKAALLTDLEQLRAGLEGRDPLCSPADIGRAEWLSWPRDAYKQERGEVVSEVYEGGSFATGGLAYAFRLPKDYDPRGHSYPLILTIPDENESPADHLRQHWVLRELLDQAILFCPQMPKLRVEWDQVVVEGRPGGLSHVLTAYRLATERLAVDPDRVYVVGRGKGVVAAIAAGNTSPHRFAGVVGRAGEPGAIGPENFSQLPTLFAGGGALASAFQERAKAAGHDNVRVQLEATESDIWYWMLEHPRAAQPTSVRIVVGNPFPTRVYWMRVAPTAPDTHAEASIDRDTNTIEITCHGTSQVALFLNDALVDLGRPVTFRCNGVESSSMVRRSLPTTLSLLEEGLSDPGAMYVAQYVCDLNRQGSGASVAAAPDADFDERFAAAGEDADRLWELDQWCRANQREARADGVLRKLLRFAPQHEEARKALGYVRSGEQWWESQRALDSFLHSQEEAVAKAMGHVKHQGLWMHPDERAEVDKGLVKDQATGQWLSAADRKRLTEGWVRQDLEWIPPTEAARVDEGSWLVDGEWMDLVSANRRHSSIGSMWRIPSRELLVYSTADRDVALRAMQEMSRALEDLRRVFGAEPVLPISVAVMRDEEQYDRMAFGDPDGRRPPTHVARLQIIHSAYFAESWFRRVERRFEFQGMGVCYWDADAPSGDLYGVHAARLAVGLSYVEALDPSPKTVRKALSQGPPPNYYASYVAEKKLPAWLRYGGAVYAERYFRDTSVPADGDPWWARKWSIDNLRQRGGMRALSEILAFPIDPDKRDDSLKLLIECGLLVAFLVDGECAPVLEEHARFKQALALGRLHPNGIEALEQSLLDHEAEIRTFAGL
jgi:hypothetical protein